METVTDLNALITATIATRLSIIESMVESQSTADHEYKQLRVSELTKIINDAESKIRALNKTTPRIRPIRMYPVK